MIHEYLFITLACVILSTFGYIISIILSGLMRSDEIEEDEEEEEEAEDEYDDPV